MPPVRAVPCGCRRWRCGFNCLRDLADAGELTVAELARRARMGINLDGMRRWGLVTIEGWDGFREGAVRRLHSALEPIVGDGTRDGSPLFAGLQPPAEGWRAQVAQPEMLPWHPMVAHRGGYPDGG